MPPTSLAPSIRHGESTGTEAHKRTRRRRFVLGVAIVGYLLGTATMWYSTMQAAHAHHNHHQQDEVALFLPPLPQHNTSIQIIQDAVRKLPLASFSETATTLQTPLGPTTGPTPAQTQQTTSSSSSSSTSSSTSPPIAPPTIQPTPTPVAAPPTKLPTPPKPKPAEPVYREPLKPRPRKRYGSLPNEQERQKVREIQQQSMQRPCLALTAHVEPPLATKKPLPLRTHSMDKLQTYSYPDQIRSCRDLPNGWPVDHPPQMDRQYGPMANRMRSLYPHREAYAQEFCPVDADPFLPWIHDAFPSRDGRYLEVVAHNKRRCRQDPEEFQADIDNLEPQVALLQSIPIQRVDILQKASNGTTNLPESWTKAAKNGEEFYQLTHLHQADADAKETRFICQFHTLRPKTMDDSKNTNTTKQEELLEKVILGQSLSVYPYNYEHANYRHKAGQSANPMLTRPKNSKDINGIHNEQVWNAILHLRCPIPEELQSSVADGSTIDPNGSIPSVYLDLVPIRTPPREQLQGYNPYQYKLTKFQPDEEWGPSHILPPISHSGRWSNIPICHTSFEAASAAVSSLTSNDASLQKGVDPSSKAFSAVNSIQANNTKENYLVGCLWASAAFSIRGEERLDTTTMTRLLEWLTYHLEVAGFDKIIVYDNTEAFTNIVSLESVTDLFPGERVIRVPWKHRVCNNNRPTHPNAGERSSQYAAEASCRLRYGPTTEWIMTFDTDEYLVPQGNYTSIQRWLKDSVQSGAIRDDTHILNFYQIRALLNKRFTERYYDDSHDCRESCAKCHCIDKRANATFLETYCDPAAFPRPDFTARAKKQLYRPDFVLNHFVHYAAVTRLINDRPEMHRVVGWPYERRVVEATEAFMIHAKTKAARRTKYWKDLCSKSDKCPIGLPWPHYMGENQTSEEGMFDENGFPYTCYEHRKVNELLGPKLRTALEPLLAKWKQPDIVFPEFQDRLKHATKPPISTLNPAPSKDSSHGDQSKTSFQPSNSTSDVTQTQTADALNVTSQASLTLTKGRNITRIRREIPSPVYDIQDFDPSVSAVIATKIQGNQTVPQLEQNMCLLNSAYNHRVHHDIVIFMANEISEGDKDRIRKAAAPANVTFELDNPGLRQMIDALTPEQRSKLVRRCNVTDASQLTWKTRCHERSSGGYSNMPIQYTWQAEFRSLHLWKHPTLAKYKYMMWLDSDGFCTREWKQDPIATAARHDLAILFDHFPQGNARGKEWPEKIQEAFGEVYCRVDMQNGHLVAKTGDCLHHQVNIKQIHGFFHVTSLDFYRSEAVMKWAKVMVGDSKFSRMHDDQIGVTMPAAVLAGNRSWDMRHHGLNLGVLHSYKLDGQQQFGGFLKYWKNEGRTAFPSAHAKCKITQHG